MRCSKTCSLPQAIFDKTDNPTKPRNLLCQAAPIKTSTHCPRLGAKSTKAGNGDQMNDARFRDTEPTFVKLASEDPEANTPPWTTQPLAPTIIVETVDEGAEATSTLTIT